MNFQFFFESPSSLWGSYADWTMVFFTAITAFLIIATFMEQNKINAKQDRINRLQLEKGRREIRPYFKVQFQKKGIYAGVIMEDHYLVSLNHATALNVRWSVMVDNQYLKDELPESIRIWDLHHHGVWFHDLLPSKFANHDFIEVFQINYQDEEKREYSQNIVIDKGGVFTTFPKLVKDI